MRGNPKDRWDALGPNAKRDLAVGGISLAPPESTLLRSYLRHCGLLPEAHGGQLPLRFHPSLSYLEDGGCLEPYPAMLALLFDTDGRPATMHHPFLTADGRKAPVLPPNKLMPHSSDRSLIGGAVCLGPASSVLEIVEGIETALVVHQATGIIVWSALICTLLERFVPPGSTERIVIWTDRDENGAGRHSAEVLRKRLEAKGHPSQDQVAARQRKGLAGCAEPMWRRWISDSMKRFG